MTSPNLTQFLERVRKNIKMRGGEFKAISITINGRGESTVVSSCAEPERTTILRTSQELADYLLREWIGDGK